MKNTKQLIAWMAMTIIAHTGWTMNMAHADDTEVLKILMEQELMKRAAEFAAGRAVERIQKGSAESQQERWLEDFIGEGVTLDGEQAAQWLQKPVEQEYEEAIESLKKSGFSY